MDVHPYYGPGNIVIDTCVECGLVWLDHGELTRVEQASAAQASVSAWNRSENPDIGQRSANEGSDDSPSERRSPLQFLADLLF